MEALGASRPAGALAAVSPKQDVAALRTAVDEAIAKIGRLAQEEGRESAGLDTRAAVGRLVEFTSAGSTSVVSIRTLRPERPEDEESEPEDERRLSVGASLAELLELNLQEVPAAEVEASEEGRPTLGDLVRVVPTYHTESRVGQVGRVVKDDRSDIPFKVEFGNGEADWLCRKHVVKEGAASPVLRAGVYDLRRSDVATASAQEDDEEAEEETDDDANAEQAAVLAQIQNLKTALARSKSEWDIEVERSRRNRLHSDKAAAWRRQRASSSPSELQALVSDVEQTLGGVFKALFPEGPGAFFHSSDGMAAQAAVAMPSSIGRWS